MNEEQINTKHSGITKNSKNKQEAKGVKTKSDNTIAGQVGNQPAPCIAAEDVKRLIMKEARGVNSPVEKKLFGCFWDRISLCSTGLS